MEIKGSSSCGAAALWAAPRRALFQAQANVDPVDDADDDGLPGNQVPEPVEQLPVQEVRPLPAGG